MHWAADYVGKPWQSGSYGPDAYDCWGLVRAVLLQRASILIPDVGADAKNIRSVASAFREQHHYAGWHKVAPPLAELDVALMTQSRHPVHVGLWIDADHGRILHATAASGVVAMSLTALKVEGYKIVGWYRHGPDA